MNDLHNHLEEHTCHICNNIFQSVSDLKQHILTHVKVINQINQFFAVDDIFSKDFKDEDSLEERPKKKNHVNNNQEISFEPSKNHTHNFTKEKENNTPFSGVEFISTVKVEDIVDSKNATCLKICNDEAAVLDIIEENRRSHSPSNEFIANKDSITTTFTDLSETVKKLDKCVPSATVTLSHQTLEGTDTLQSCTEDGNVILQDEQPCSPQSIDDDHIETNPVIHACEKSSTFHMRKEHLTSKGNFDTQSASPCNSKLRCNICNKTFVHSSSLKQHKTIHSDNNPFNCGDCGKNFSSLSHLHDHMLVHTGEKPHLCLLCNLGFSQTGNLNRHIRRRHSDIIFCKTCGKIFEDVLLLTLHLKSHTSKEQRIVTNSYVEQVDRGYARCLLCKSLFSNVENLDQHNRRYHSTIKCKSCDKMYENEISLTLHLKSHTSIEKVAGNSANTEQGNKNITETGVDKIEIPIPSENQIDKAQCLSELKPDQSEQSKSATPVSDNEQPCSPNLIDDGESNLTKLASNKSTFFVQKKQVQSKGNLNDQNTSSFNSNFTCKKCNKVLKNSESLRQHIRCHTNRYVCGDCGKIFSRISHLQQHMLVHTGDRPHVCLVCDSRFTLTGNLNRHIRRRHSNINFCKVCGKIFEDVQLLTLHLKSHTSNEQRISNTKYKKQVDKGYAKCRHCKSLFSNARGLAYHYRRDHIMACKSCGKIFENETLLKVHLKTHKSLENVTNNSAHINNENKENTNDSANQLELFECQNEGLEDQIKTENCEPLIKPIQEIACGSTIKSKKLFTCKVCKKIFNRPSLLHRHSFCHTGENPILCSICGKYYASKYHLYIHMKTHANNKYYTCEICGKKVKWLEAHLRSHISEKRFTCEICGNRYMHKGGFMEHKKIHNTKDKCYCDHCNKSFSKKRSIYLHIRDTHLGKGAAHTCHICKKKISGGKGHLKAHILLHSGVKTHECNICGKKCAHAGNLKKHMFTHSNEQPFSCEQCKQRFKTRANLKTHMLIHTGEKPHKCGICGQKFRQRGSVKIHMRNIHSK